jgi:hypothetical protein
MGPGGRRLAPGPPFPAAVLELTDQCRVAGTRCRVPAPSDPCVPVSPAHGSSKLTLAEVAALPAVTDLVTAGRALGLGRTRAYELARAGQFPCPVIRAGQGWRVPTAGVLTVLGLPVPGPPGRSPDLDAPRPAVRGSTGPADSAGDPGHRRRP